MKKNPTEELDQKNPTSKQNPGKPVNKINPGTIKKERETDVLDDDDDQYEDVENDNITDDLED